jgi:hypothetical protein
MYSVELSLSQPNSAFSHSTKWHFAAQISVAHFTYVFHPLASFLLSSLRKNLLKITGFDQTLAIRNKTSASPFSTETALVRELHNTWTSFLPSQRDKVLTILQRNTLYCISPLSCVYCLVVIQATDHTKPMVLNGYW